MSGSTWVAAALAVTAAGHPVDLPDLQQVQAWAATEAGRAPPPGALRRARWRGVLPHLTLRFGTDLDLDVRDASTRTVSEAQGLDFDAWARWRLPDLVFHPDELRVLRETRIGRSARRSARVQVTELYFERLQVRAARRARDSGELRRAAQRLDGLLDALTGGAYGRWRAGGAP